MGLEGVEIATREFWDANVGEENDVLLPVDPCALTDPSIAELREHRIHLLSCHSRLPTSV